MPLLIVVCAIAIVQVAMWFNRENINRMLLSSQNGNTLFEAKLAVAAQAGADGEILYAADYLPRLRYLLGMFIQPTLIIGAGYILAQVFPIPVWVWALLSTSAFVTFSVVQSNTLHESEPPAARLTHTAEESAVHRAVNLLSAVTLTATLTVAYTDGRTWRDALSATCRTHPDTVHVLQSLPVWFWDAIAAIVVLAGLWLTYAIIRFGGRLADRYASPRFELRTDDDTLLYLRSFTDDDIKIHDTVADPLTPVSIINLRTVLWPRISFEEMIAISTSVRTGNLITVGRPGEQLPKAGAVRGYYAQDDWREGVRLTAFRAKGIILTLGATTSLGWEISHIKQWGLLSKCLFLVPPRPNDDLPHRLEPAFDALGISSEERAKAYSLPASCIVAFHVLHDGTVQWMVAHGRDWGSYFVALQEFDDWRIQQVTDDTHYKSDDGPTEADDYASSLHEGRKYMRSHLTMAPAEVRMASLLVRKGSKLMRMQRYEEAVREYDRAVRRWREERPEGIQGIAYLLWNEFLAAHEGQYCTPDAYRNLTQDLVHSIHSLDCVWVTRYRKLRPDKAEYEVEQAVANFARDRIHDPDLERHARLLQLQAAIRMRDLRLLSRAGFGLSVVYGAMDDMKGMRKYALFAFTASRRIGDLRMMGDAARLAGWAMSRSEPTEEHWKVLFAVAVDALDKCGEQQNAVLAAHQFLDSALLLADGKSAARAAELGLQVTPESDMDLRRLFEQHLHDDEQ